jgi:hypothetical protein
MGTTKLLGAFGLVVVLAAPAAAQTEYEEVPAEDAPAYDEGDDTSPVRDDAARRAAQKRRRAQLRDPQGSVLVGVTGGASFSSNFNYGTLGAHVGYAVLNGVVPGIRGAFFFGDLTGGEFAGTLWLTPPLALPIVPFAVGEIGYASQSYRNITVDGALYGAGGGLHFGSPADRFNLRAGVIYRYYDGDDSDYWSPLLVFSFRF